MTPTIRIEIDSIRHTVQQCFADSTNEFTRQVERQLEATLTTEWVQNEIIKAVDTCIKSAISQIGTDYRLQNAISGAISNQLTGIINGKST